MDNLGAEIPRGRKRAGVGADLAGTTHHSWTRDMVLSRQTSVAPSPHFHLPSVGDQFVTIDRLSAASRRVGRYGCFVVAPREMDASRIFCRRILSGFAISRARIFQCLFLPLFVCERSFPVSREHGTACLSWSWHHRGDRCDWMEIVSPARGMRTPLARTRRFNVAPKRHLSRHRSVVHRNVGKKSWLLDGSLQSGHRSSR